MRKYNVNRNFNFYISHLYNDKYNVRTNDIVSDATTEDEKK